MKKIRTRICVFMIGLVVTILIVVWLLQVTFLQDLYRYYKAEDVKNIQVEMVKKFNEQDVQSAYKSIWQMAQENELYVAIYDKNRNSIVTPFSYMDSLPMNFRFSPAVIKNYQDILNHAINEMERTRNSTYVMYSDEGNEKADNVVVISKILAADGEYYIFTRAPLAPVKATTNILQRNHGMIMMVGIFLAIIAAFVLAEYISRPIRALSKGAKAVANGNLSYYIPEKSDTTEMGQLLHDFNHMTQELSRVDRLRKDLVANVSHELRTPLTMIKGYAETVRDLTGDIPEKRNRQMDIIVEETDRLSGLITDLLDLSQLQAGKQSFRMTEINFSETVQRVANRYDIFKERGYSIETDIDEGIVINGDENRLEQVIYNLIDNAINHCGEDKRIRISLKCSPEICFSVQNTGDVISKEDLPYIWDRFYHMDKSGKRRITGTGIGLSIVREVLEIHGFAYGVSSDENGTVFWFRPKR